MSDYEVEMEVTNKLNELEDRWGKEDREQLIADYRAVLSTPEGRRVISSICGRGGVFGFVYNKAKGDAISLAYNTGRRECATDVYVKANMAAPELVLKMFEERNKLEHARAAQRKTIWDQL